MTAGLSVAAGAQPPRPSYFADKQPASDDLIYDNVKRRLANDADVKGGALEIDVKDGLVTLRGKLETQRQIDKATKLAKKVNGVKKVVNEIQLSTK
ncbi:MAG TPA: BON domain-containing protein [Bryobacteraceae bacterium]|nr:BON domain-containing protein [Bryobacteraceae bacterium]